MNLEKSYVFDEIETLSRRKSFPESILVRMARKEGKISIKEWLKRLIQQR